MSDATRGAAEVDARAGVWLAAAVLLVAAGVLGGASRENPLRLAAVEIASLPLLFLIQRHWRRFGLPREAASALLMIAAVLAVPALQSLPLPPAIWTRLPGRAAEVAAAAAAGAGGSWLPASLAPHETVSALLALAPPAAMGLSPFVLGPRGLGLLAGGWLALATAGLVLGAAQLATPGPGPAYLYAATNYGSLVGFFANRNHEAAFLLALLPFGAAFAADPGRRAGRSDLIRMAGALFAFLAVIGIGVVRSRAGILLVGPTLLGCGALLWKAQATGARGGRSVALVGVAAAVAAVAAFSLSPILQRFDAEIPSDFRFEAWPVVARAASDYQPVGAGVGAFDRAFRSVEPLAMVGPAYFNHAHNDWLELWLETGWPGALVAAVLIAGLCVAFWRVWRGPGRGETMLARAASVSILALASCSLVDYPLRTECLATLFAWCCGLLMARARAAGRGR